MGKPNVTDVFRSETDTYKFEAKKGVYVTVKDRNVPGNNLIFSDKKKLTVFINHLQEAKKKL